MPCVFGSGRFSVLCKLNRSCGEPGEVDRAGLEQVDVDHGECEWLRQRKSRPETVESNLRFSFSWREADSLTGRDVPFC